MEESKQVLSTQNLSSRKFGLRDKICYAFGDVANDFTFIMISSFMLVFYTDVMKIDAAIVGALMAAARILDAFTDIGMGTLVDMTDPAKSKFGKFRIWMLRGCIPVVVMGFLVFGGGLIADAPYAVRLVWMFVTYLLWGSVFYTCVNIPYGSMASSITDDPNQRTQLSSFRSIGATIAGLVLGVAGPLVVYVKDDAGNSVLSNTRMMIFAGVCALLALISYLICIFGSVDRVYLPPKKKEPKAEKDPNEKNILVTLITDKSLVILIIGTIFMLLTQLTQQSMAQYIYPKYYSNTTAQAVASMVGCIAMIVMALIAPKLVKKFGKRELGIFSMFAGSVVYLVAFVIRPQNVWVFVVFCILSYAALGTFSSICFAMIIDVIDNAEVKTGKRDDGKYYGVYSFARKLGQAASSLISGALLSLISYGSLADLLETIASETATASEIEAAEASAQPILEGIFNITTLVPAIGFAVSGIFLVIYPLKKKIVDANSEELRRRRENG